ncbi:DDE transposase [Helicobacter cetorum]|nr:DDE transposase [Helicobacter cetorum]
MPLMFKTLFSKHFFSACLAFLVATPLSAKSYLFSPLPPAHQQVFRAHPCSLECLRTLMRQNKVFSFVSKYDYRTQDKALKAYYLEIINKLNPPYVISNASHKDKWELKADIAVLLPKAVVGRYAISVLNSILAYLNTKEGDFRVQVFDSDQEDPDQLFRAYQEIEKAKYPFVIALLTKNGVENLLKKTSISIPTYVPSVHKTQLEITQANQALPERLYFGGIDYKEQLKMLLPYINLNAPIIEYDDDGIMGEHLRQVVESLKIHVKYQENISYRRATSFSKGFKKDEDFFKDSMLILNTPTIKSGLILSQIGLLDDKPSRVFSTQINFNPSLLLLVQPKDRRNLLIVNALQESNDKLVEYASLLESDLVYDWVNYSSAIGVEMFLGILDPKLEKYFHEILEDNQVQYVNQIYQALGHSFEPMKK